MKRTFDINAKYDHNMIWCTCLQEPGVYGYYNSEGEASVDLRYQIIHEIMFKEKRLPEEEIELHFEYD